MSDRDPHRSNSDEIERLGTDHLIPLPEATPFNMWRMFARGFVIGVVVMLLDVLVTHYLLGLSHAYITLALSIMLIFAVTGAFKDDSVPMVMSSLTGILIGALGANMFRVKVLGASSLLAGVGL